MSRVPAIRSHGGVYARHESLRADEAALVVNNPPRLLDFLAGILPCSGCRVPQAHDGVDSRSHSRRHHQYLIVSNVEMPRMGGIEIWRRVRQDMGRIDTPFVRLSGSRINGARARAGFRAADSPPRVGTAAPLTEERHSDDEAHRVDGQLQIIVPRGLPASRIAPRVQSKCPPVPRSPLVASQLHSHR